VEIQKLQDKIQKTNEQLEKISPQYEEERHKEEAAAAQ